VVNQETGKVEIIEELTTMTPTEYAIMTGIWSWWWTHESDPWPSVEQICSHVGKSERQVRRYLSRLREKGFMVSVSQHGSDGKQLSNRYDFTPFLRRLIGFLDTLETTVGEEPLQREKDRSDRERRTDLSGRGCQIRHPKQDEAESETSKTEKEDSKRRSRSLETKSGYGTLTIRNIQQPESEKREAKTKESKFLGKEMSAEVAKEVKAEKREKKQWHQPGERPAQPLPERIASCLRQAGAIFGDQASASSLTRVTWPYLACQLRGMTEGTFIQEIVLAAEMKTHKRAELKWYPLHNPMAWFLNALENEAGQWIKSYDAGLLASVSPLEPAHEADQEGQEHEKPQGETRPIEGGKIEQGSPVDLLPVVPNTPISGDQGQRESQGSEPCEGAEPSATCVEGMSLVEGSNLAALKEERQGIRVNDLKEQLQKGRIGLGTTSREHGWSEGLARTVAKWLADQIPATYWQRHTLALRPTRCKDRLGILLLDETGETMLEEFVTREEIKSWINMQQAVGFDGPGQSME
jgi:hypothetical protein